jgi:ribose transport system permease protein
MNISRGLVYALCEGKSIAGLPTEFTSLGQSKAFGIQIPIIIAIALVIVGDIVMRKSKYFRQSYFVGANAKAAQLSGIKVRRFRMASYTLTGLFAGFAGLIQAGRLGAAMATTGVGLEMKVLTAVIIGGASLSGGEGTVLGAFLGSILMATVTNAVNLLGVNVYWQTFIVGMTLLIAILIDRIGKHRKAHAMKIVSKV